MRRHVRNISLFYKLIRTVKKRPPSAIKWRIQYQNCHCGYIKYLFTIFKSIFYLKLQKEIVQIANYSQTQTLQRYISNGSFRSFMLLKPQGFCLKYGFLNNLFQRSSNISHVLRQVMNFVGAMWVFIHKILRWKDIILRIWTHLRGIEERILQREWVFFTVFVYSYAKQCSSHKFPTISIAVPHTVHHMGRSVKRADYMSSHSHGIKGKGKLQAFSGIKIIMIKQSVCWYFSESGLGKSRFTMLDNVRRAVLFICVFNVKNQNLLHANWEHLRRLLPSRFLEKIHNITWQVDLLQNKMEIKCFYDATLYFHVTQKGFRKSSQTCAR